MTYVRTRPRLSIPILWFVVSGLALVTAAAPAAAHSVLKRSEPAAGSTVDVVVDTIVLEFLGSVLEDVRVTVTGPGDGPSVEATAIALSEDDTVVTASVTPIAAPGRYRVEFDYHAADGAAQSGVLAFDHVGAAPAVSTPTSSDGLTLPVTARTLRLFLHLVAATVWIGGQLVLLGLLPVVRTLGEDAPRRIAARFGILAWSAFAVLVATGVWALAELEWSARSATYQSTVFVKLVLVGLSGASTLVHTRTRSKALLAIGGAGSLVAALGAAFVGVQLVIS